MRTGDDVIDLAITDIQPQGQRPAAVPPATAEADACRFRALEGRLWLLSVQVPEQSIDRARQFG